MSHIHRKQRFAGALFLDLKLIEVAARTEETRVERETRVQASYQ